MNNIVKAVLFGVPLGSLNAAKISERIILFGKDVGVDNVFIDSRDSKIKIKINGEIKDVLGLQLPYDEFYSYIEKLSEELDGICVFVHSGRFSEAFLDGEEVILARQNIFS